MSRLEIPERIAKLAWQVSSSDNRYMGYGMQWYVFWRIMVRMLSHVDNQHGMYFDQFEATRRT